MRKVYRPKNSFLKKNLGAIGVAVFLAIVLLLVTLNFNAVTSLFSKADCDTQKDPECAGTAAWGKAKEAGLSDEQARRMAEDEFNRIEHQNKKTCGNDGECLDKIQKDHDDAHARDVAGAVVPPGATLTKEQKDRVAQQAKATCHDDPNSDGYKKCIQGIVNGQLGVKPPPPPPVAKPKPSTPAPVLCVGQPDPPHCSGATQFVGCVAGKKQCLKLDFSDCEKYKKVNVYAYDYCVGVDTMKARQMGVLKAGVFSDKTDVSGAQPAKEVFGRENSGNNPGRCGPDPKSPCPGGGIHYCSASNQWICVGGNPADTGRCGSQPAPCTDGGARFCGSDNKWTCIGGGNAVGGTNGTGVSTGQTTQVDNPEALKCVAANCHFSSVEGQFKCAVGCAQRYPPITAPVVTTTQTENPEAKKCAAKCPSSGEGQFKCLVGCVQQYPPIKTSNPPKTSNATTPDSIGSRSLLPCQKEYDSLDSGAYISCIKALPKNSSENEAYSYCTNLKANKDVHGVLIDDCTHSVVSNGGLKNYKKIVSGACKSKCSSNFPEVSASCETKCDNSPDVTTQPGTPTRGDSVDGNKGLVVAPPIPKEKATGVDAVLLALKSGIASSINQSVKDNIANIKNPDAADFEQKRRKEQYQYAKDYCAQHSSGITAENDCVAGYVSLIDSGYKFNFVTGLTSPDETYLQNAKDDPRIAWKIQQYEKAKTHCQKQVVSDRISYCLSYYYDLILRNNVEVNVDDGTTKSPDNSSYAQTPTSGTGDIISLRCAQSYGKMGFSDLVSCNNFYTDLSRSGWDCSRFPPRSAQSDTQINCKAPPDSVSENQRQWIQLNNATAYCDKSSHGDLNVRSLCISYRKDQINAGSNIDPFTGNPVKKDGIFQKAAKMFGAVNPDSSQTVNVPPRVARKTNDVKNTVAPDTGGGNQTQPGDNQTSSNPSTMSEQQKNVLTGLIDLFNRLFGGLAPKNGGNSL